MSSTHILVADLVEVRLQALTNFPEALHREHHRFTEGFWASWTSWGTRTVPMKCSIACVTERCKRRLFCRRFVICAEVSSMPELSESFVCDHFEMSKDCDGTVFTGYAYLSQQCPASSESVLRSIVSFGALWRIFCTFDPRNPLLIWQNYNPKSSKVSSFHHFTYRCSMVLGWNHMNNFVFLGCICTMCNFTSLAIEEKGTFV